MYKERMHVSSVLDVGTPESYGLLYYHSCWFCVCVILKRKTHKKTVISNVPLNANNSLTASSVGLAISLGCSG